MARGNLLTVFNYAKSALTARKLLANFGRTIQHQKVTEGTYNPDTGAVINTTLNTDVKACDFDFKGQEYQANSLVQIGDRYALVASDILAIDTSDKLIIDTVTWNIINVEKLAPAGVSVLWKCQIRR